MRTRARRSFMVVIVALAACRPDERVAPRLPSVDAPLSAVYPAAAYAISTLPDYGWFSDVNEKNVMAGTITGVAGNALNAFSYQPGGLVKLLAMPGGMTSAANAVNNHGAVVGTVSYGNFDNRPAVWSDPSALPLVAGIQGVAYDINGAGLVVGTAIVNGGQFGFVWDTTSKPVKLPPLPGGLNTTASAVNADRIILGASSSRAGWTSVLWRFNGSVWVPTAITGGINALALDNATTVVGQTAGEASWGKPNHAGFLGVGVWSYATAVTSNGRVAVGNSFYPVLGPTGANNAFVADRSGAVTMLPIPSSWWTAATGRGVNSCGLAVGSLTFNSMGAHPASWNPGC